MVDAVCCSFSCLSHPLSFGGSARLPSPASRRCDKVARSLDLDQSLVDCFSLSGRACESGETVDPVVTGGTQTDGTRKDVEGSSLVIGEKKSLLFFPPYDHDHQRPTRRLAGPGTLQPVARLTGLSLLRACCILVRVAMSCQTDGQHRPYQHCWPGAHNALAIRVESLYITNNVDATGTPD